jgi:thiamine-phosphate pyrophosphorylase
MITNNKLYRIIDANVNRSMEGIRVVEDILRFELDDKAVTSRLKNLRSDLKKVIDSLGLPRAELLKARDSKKDVGADLYSEGESKRTNVNQIITSNFKRIEESLRVLEETSKLFDTKFGRRFKSLRYNVYDLEKEISSRISHLASLSSKEQKLDFDLYVVTDPDVRKDRSPEKAVKSAVAAGVKIVQLRDKKASKKQYLAQARKISRIVKGTGAAFIVNDHIDICKEVDADGIHLGQDDPPVSIARSILGEDKIIGFSTHSFKQAVNAEKAGADYISVGPIFPTPSKEGVLPVGLKLLKKVKQRVKIPIVAIGGINDSNIYNVKRAGVKRAAVIRAVVGVDNIKSAVKRLRSRLK